MSLCSLPRESPNDITTGNIIRNAHWIRNVHVYHGVFKVGNTAGEYTKCSSSPHILYNLRIKVLKSHLVKNFDPALCGIPWDQT
jgi:hypothetical protein